MQSWLCSVGGGSRVPPPTLRVTGYKIKTLHAATPLPTSSIPQSQTVRELRSTSLNANFSQSDIKCTCRIAIIRMQSYFVAICCCESDVVDLDKVCTIRDQLLVHSKAMVSSGFELRFFVCRVIKLEPPLIQLDFHYPMKATHLNILLRLLHATEWNKWPVI